MPGRPQAGARERHFPWKCCKVFCALVVTVKTSVLRATTKKVVNFFEEKVNPGICSPSWKKSCWRP